MKLISAALLCIGALLCQFSSMAQTNASSVKFGDITAKDFAASSYSIDKDARAVILYDKGSAEYHSSTERNFEVIYTYHYRIRLLDKSSFDRASIEFALFHVYNTGDVLDDLQGATYNLENGQVVKTKLEKSAVFTEKASDNVDIKKFTFPNLKEGCIIEYTARIISPNFSDIRDWVFQDSYPVLHSEYKVDVPQYFDYVFLTGGYYKPTLTSVESSKIFDVNFRFGVGESAGQNGTKNLDTRISTWTLENLPAMKKEKYTSAMTNHLSKVEFQLRTIEGPDGYSLPIIRTWGEIIEQILKSGSFGKDINEPNRWLTDDVKKALDPKNDTAKTAENIFLFVRDNFTCTDHDANTLSGPLKKTYDSKKGNVADLNILMLSMLRKANISAEPVMLSTRDNGFANEQYPLISKFNYVIIKAMISNKQYLLDASVKKLGFNHLPDYCYNGSGRTIDNTAALISLSADSITETKNTSVFIINPEDGKPEINGHVTSALGYFESFEMRKKPEAENATELLKEIKNKFGTDITISEAGVDFLDDYNGNAELHYDFSLPSGEKLLYFNPMQFEGYKTNPFTASVRSYPVEMPYRTRESIIVNMQIPKGYKIDELPKSERMDLPDDMGSFEYIVVSDATSLRIKSKITIKKANFAFDDYDTLREFFSFIVKKHAEQIVFKKL